MICHDWIGSIFPLFEHKIMLYLIIDDLLDEVRNKGFLESMRH